MLVEVWSDVVCPWCYIGKRHLEEALAGFEHADTVEVRWRSFELDPNTPPHDEITWDLADHLASKFGMNRAQAMALNDRMAATAAKDGLEYHLDRARPANSFNAHRLVHIARGQGAEAAMQERLFRAYFTEGVLLDDTDELCRLAEDAGLDSEDVRVRLLAGDGADAVRADEREAAELGISGVPFFVIDRRYGISGAQPASVIAEVLEKSWRPNPSLSVIAGGDSAAGG